LAGRVVKLRLHRTSETLETLGLGSGSGVRAGAACAAGRRAWRRARRR